MKIFLAILLTLIVVPISAGYFSNILTQEDFDMQREHFEDGPTMTSVSGDWKSYNQWQCFNVNQIEFDCAVYDYDKKLVPHLKIQYSSFRYEFDLHVEDGFDCRKTLETWADLMDGSREICIYAAFMPGVRETDYPSDWYLWYIHTIKTSNGYWNLFAPKY